jgi:hypothetical protein
LASAREAFSHLHPFSRPMSNEQQEPTMDTSSPADSEIADERIPYRVTPTVYGVPITDEVRAAIRTLDAALVIARRSSSGLTLGGLVGTIRERLVKAESDA